MTQVHILPGRSCKLSMDDLVKSTRSIINSVVSADGQFSLGRRPSGYWYVQHLGMGSYRVVHNLNRIDYAVSVSKITDDALCMETYDLDDVSFKLSIQQDGSPVDRPFSFALNIQNG